MKHAKYVALALTFLALIGCSENSLSNSSSSSVNYNEIEDDRYDHFVAQDNVERYDDFNSLKDAVSNKVVSEERNFYILDAEGYQTENTWNYFNVYYDGEEGEYRNVTIRERYGFYVPGLGDHVLSNSPHYVLYVSINLSCIFYPLNIDEGGISMKFEYITIDKGRVTIFQSDTIVGYVYASYLHSYREEYGEEKVDYLMEYLEERLVALK